MADPMTAERLAKAVEQRPDRYRTHWEGCETDVKHGDCAIRFLLGQLSAAQQEIAAMREAQRDAFKAGFLAVWNRQKDDKPAHWSFDGPSAADLEPKAWLAWIDALAPRTPGEP